MCTRRAPVYAGPGALSAAPSGALSAAPSIAPPEVGPKAPKVIFRTCLMRGMGLVR